MSFATQIKQITVNTANVVTFEPAKIWWHNGVKAAKTPGSFYCRASDYPSGLGEPWTPEERFDGEPGYSTPTLTIAVLAVRSQPFRKMTDADGRKYSEYVTHYQRGKGMSIHTEVLCFMAGYADPVVWSIKGLTGAAVTGKAGLLKAYENGLLRDAVRIAGQALPRWTFWLPISSKRLAENKIAYEDTGFGSYVTPPALFLPENPIDTLFVGEEVLMRGSAVLKQYPNWESFKRLPAGTVEGNYTIAAPALPAPRNVPQSVSDDDDTF